MLRSMKDRIMFCRPDRCSGCLLCEMACSLAISGKCGRRESMIHVLTHPRFGTSQPVVSERCAHTVCEIRCAQVCNADALRLVPESKAASFLVQPEWVPAPVLPGAED